MGSQDELVADLMRKPRNSFRDQLVKNATDGLYHDYKSDEPAPKLLLVHDLTKYGYRDLARKATRGLYNDKPDTDDDAALAADLAANPELAALWEEMKKVNDPKKAMELAFAHFKDLTPEERAIAMVESFGIDHPEEKP